MALFTSKADMDIPALTQFYQVEGDGELEEFTRRFSPFYELMEKSDKVSESGKRQYLINETNLLKGIEKPLKELMFSFATNIKFNKENLFLFVDKYNKICKLEVSFSEHSPLYIVNDMPNKIYFSKENFIKPDYLYVYGDSHFHSVEDVLIFQFIDKLKETHGLQKREKLFLLCHECSNVFVVQKEGQAYCSQRCRSRVGERRRYALRMEGYPSRYKKRV